MPIPGRNDEGDYRYKFQGQEKDPETGMEAFELRLWDGRIGRWLTVDPKRVHHSPYVGMGNNPIILIDPDGGKPTPYEAALMAAKVYGHDVDLSGGWELSKNTTFNIDHLKSGLYATLFERDLGNGEKEYVYVFRGSESGADWINNLLQLSGDSEQYKRANDIVISLDVILKQQEVTFVGHSLGGGLSNYSSLATGRASITFDPAWVSRASKRKLKKTKSASITNYIHRGTGTLHAVQTVASFSHTALLFESSTGDNKFIGNFYPAVDLIEGHDILNIINSLYPINLGTNSNLPSRHERVISPRFF